MPTSRLVDVDGLTVSYGDPTAVSDLTFHVQHGELYALAGTNGAGRTTALEVIEGHRRPTPGTVRMSGHSPLDRRAAVGPGKLCTEADGLDPEVAGLRDGEGTRAVLAAAGSSDPVAGT
jgi:ABC-2 type transport system ATP-binding protein